MNRKDKEKKRKKKERKEEKVVGNHCLPKRQRQVRVLYEDVYSRLSRDNTSTILFVFVKGFYRRPHVKRRGCKSWFIMIYTSTRHSWFPLVIAYHIWYAIIIRTAYMRFGLFQSPLPYLLRKHRIHANVQQNPSSLRSRLLLNVARVFTLFCSPSRYARRTSPNSVYVKSFLSKLRFGRKDITYTRHVS